MILKKVVQDFRKVIYPMQTLSGRYFLKEKKFMIGFEEAKPNLTFFAGKLTFILGFSIGQMP